MEIYNFIIHNVKKDQRVPLDLKNVYKRKTEIDISENDVMFLEKVLDVYYKKSNPYYGIFDVNQDFFPYQTYVKSLFDFEIDFLTFSNQAFDQYVKILQQQNQATGGFFLVINYSYRGHRYLAIIMLNNTTTFDIDEDTLEIIPKPTLDIEKIDVANILNLDKWENNDDKYLTFSKGRKSISDYFINFIGCTVYTNAKQLNENLRTGLNAFIENNKMSHEDSQKIKMEAFSYFQKKSSKRQDVNLEEFANHVFPDRPKEFTNFLHEGQLEISASFKCELDAYRSYKFITYNSKDLNLKFNKSLVDNGTIEVDRAKSQLIITVNKSVMDQLND